MAKPKDDGSEGIPSEVKGEKDEERSRTFEGQKRGLQQFVSNTPDPHRLEEAAVKAKVKQAYSKRFFELHTFVKLKFKCQAKSRNPV